MWLLGRGNMDKNKIKNILKDISARLEECKKYEMKYAELSINDCIKLLHLIDMEVTKDSTDTI